MLNFEDYPIYKGKGDRNILVDFDGGTIGMQRIGGTKDPDIDVAKHVAIEAITRLSDKKKERLGEVILVAPLPPHDSGNAQTERLAGNVMAVRELKKIFKPHAIVRFTGTATLEHDQAAMFQGLPADDIPVTSTVAMETHDTMGSDAIISAHNTFELCLTDFLIEQGRGKCLAVVNRGDIAYSAGFLTKGKTDYPEFDSRVTRTTGRKIPFPKKLEYAQVPGKQAGKKVFVEGRMWEQVDKWMCDIEPGESLPASLPASRPSDFPQGDPSKDFVLLGGIIPYKFSPGFRYARLLKEALFADSEKRLPYARRTLNALVGIAPGEGTLPADTYTQKCLRQAASDLDAIEIPFFIVSQSFSKRKDQDKYRGHPERIGGKVISLIGLAYAEAEILIQAALGQGRLLKKKGEDFMHFVHEYTQAYLRKWEVPGLKK